MKKLNVMYAGWEEHFHLGVLADDGKDLLFEYTPDAIKRGLELSPFRLPLRTESYGNFPEHQNRLPGFINDALPDGWGKLMMDRLFRRQGRKDISPLDRLAFIGENTMGALSFEPADDYVLTREDVHLLDLAKEVRQVMEHEDESEALLRKLALTGGSPQGARPKALVYFDQKKNHMTNSWTGAGTPMLVKFPGQDEHKETCAVEAMYGQIARACGILAPNMKYFDLNKTLGAFATERFDRLNDIRIPTHTASGAAHVDFRIPQLDYVALLRLTQLMTHDSREVVKTFERCVFNVVFNNRDDHSKNFSFLMEKDGQWKLSPAYDLTFSRGPGGEHQMDICGEARSPARQDLLNLAMKAGINKQTAKETIERIVSVSARFAKLAKDHPIRKTTLSLIEKAVKENSARVR